MKKYSKYEAIPEQYRWDLAAILGAKSLGDHEANLFKLLKKQITIKETKFATKETFLASLKLDDEIIKLSNKIENYLSNSLAINLVDPVLNKRIGELDFKLSELQKQFGSELPRLFKHAQNLQKWITDPAFKDYRKELTFLLSQQKHLLADDVENFLATTSRANIEAYSTYSLLANTELDFGFATTEQGRKIKISHGNRSALLKHRDPQVRKTAYHGYAQGYLKHKQSLTNLLFQHFKQITEMAKARHYHSAIEKLIVNDRADLKLLTTIYDAVAKNKSILKKYHRAHAKFYQAATGLKMQRWDTSWPLVNVKNSYNIAETQKLVLAALEPMGQEYTTVVQRAYDERWVDYFTMPNKRSGAYSIGGSYGLDKKYILMNHDGTLRAVETLAHEMGHSLHSYYSDQNQALNASSYPIFLAEIASIFNELMLMDYILAGKISDKVKFDVLSRAIDGFEATVVVQTKWSNFEYNLYNQIEKGAAISSYEALAKVYYDSTSKFANKVTKYRADRQWAALMVPHFYYDFYVYKYAIGYIVANVFFQRYKKVGAAALENYIHNFLKAGGSDWPIAILKAAQIDLYDPTIYQEAFAGIAEKIDLYIKLGRKIFPS